MERPTLLAVGGQFNVDQWNYKERYDGVYVMRAANLSEMLSQAFFPFDVSGWGHRMPHAPWQEERVGRVLGGVHNGCVECRRHLKGACEYDGMLSFARHVHARRGDSPNSNLLPQWTIASVGDCSRTDGRCLCVRVLMCALRAVCVDGRARRARSFRNQYLIYARANLQPYKGGRYVQVARSETDDPRGPYGAFELLRITGVAEPDAQNVYFGAVKQNPLDERTLLGLFPLALTPGLGTRGEPHAELTCTVASRPMAIYRAHARCMHALCMNVHFFSSRLCGGALIFVCVRHAHTQARSSARQWTTASSASRSRATVCAGRR